MERENVEIFKTIVSMCLKKKALVIKKYRVNWNLIDAIVTMSLSKAVGRLEDEEIGTRVKRIR